MHKIGFSRRYHCAFITDPDKMQINKDKIGVRPMREIATMNSEVFFRILINEAPKLALLLKNN